MKWGGGSDGAAAAEDEELASMEEKQAGSSDARSGAATEEIDRARVPLPLLDHRGGGGGGGGGGVRGWRFSLVAALRVNEPRKPSRRGEEGRVVGHSGPIGEPEWGDPFFLNSGLPAFTAHEENTCLTEFR